MEILDDLIIASCEGGLIFFYDIGKKWALNTIFAHKDNIYDIEVAKNGVIISGSTDRKVGIYKNDNLEKIDSIFLVYKVGINDDGNLGLLWVMKIVKSLFLI